MGPPSPWRKRALRRCGWRQNRRVAVTRSRFRWRPYRGCARSGGRHLGRSPPAVTSRRRRGGLSYWLVRTNAARAVGEEAQIEVGDCRDPGQSAGEWFTWLSHVTLEQPFHWSSAHWSLRNDGDSSPVTTWGSLVGLPPKQSRELARIWKKIRNLRKK